MNTPKSAALLSSGFDCAECGMRCEPASAFHPWLYCWLRKRGVLNPDEFLQQHGFIPDPAVWQQKARLLEDGDGA